MRLYSVTAIFAIAISQTQSSIGLVGNGHLLINCSHSPWGSWASDNGAFSQPPFPPPLIITLGPIPSLLVISLVVSGFSSFWFCVLAGDSDLCCSALATGIFITRNPLYVSLVFPILYTIDVGKIRTAVLSATPSYNPYALYRVVHLTLLTLFYPIDSHASRHVVRLIKRNRDCVTCDSRSWLSRPIPSAFLFTIHSSTSYFHSRDVREINTSATLTVPLRERGSKYHLRRRTLISGLADVCATRRDRYRIINARAFSRGPRRAVTWLTTSKIRS